jgi:hypothetical protein
LRFPENIKTKYPNHKTVFKNHLETFWEKFVQPTYETPDEKFPTERVVKNRYCDVRNVIDKHIPYSVKQSNRPEHEEHIIFNNTPLR